MAGGGWESWRRERTQMLVKSIDPTFCSMWRRRWHSEGRERMTTRRSRLSDTAAAKWWQSRCLVGGQGTRHCWMATTRERFLERRSRVDAGGIRQKRDEADPPQIHKGLKGKAAPKKPLRPSDACRHCPTPRISSWRVRRCSPHDSRLAGGWEAESRVMANMHTCIQAHMRACIHAYIYACIHAYMRTCICA